MASPVESPLMGNQSLLLRAATLYGTYQKLSHTKEASTLGLATQWGKKAQSEWSGDWGEFYGQAGGLHVFEHSVVDHLRHRTKDLLTDCNDYSDSEHVSGAMRFHQLRLSPQEGWGSPSLLPRPSVTECENTYTPFSQNCSRSG